MEEISVPILIAGGGPCGLMLANELGRRGVAALLVDDKPSTAFNPQANATQARTMEHYRRLGFADEIRSLGLPPEFPTDIAYFTRYSRYELARFPLPSSRNARGMVAGLGSSWSAAELPHRASQKFVEAVLRRHAEALPGIDIRYGWRLLDFRDEGTHVRCEIERLSDGHRKLVRCEYLFGADGPRSLVREKLGFKYVGDAGVVRDFMGGRMYALYLNCPAFYKMVPHIPAWMSVTFNPDRRAFMAAVDGKGEFAFHTQLRAHENAEDISEAAAKGLFHAAMGIEIDVDILSRGSWTAGHALVSNHLQRGRVLIGGDAAHLFTPAGGLGYNTAVDDAVNIGWKLAAVLKRAAAPSLLDSYEIERRPVAVRNTEFAREFADSLGLVQVDPRLEDESSEGEEARRRAGEYFSVHAKTEFNIPGVTFGARYDGSPVIVPDGSRPPPDSANSYTPTACPGGRAPHVWLSDACSLFDVFGFEWTLLRMNGPSPIADDLEAAFSRHAVELKVVDVAIDEVRDLYGANEALIRPDQIVAWRSGAPANAFEIVRRVTGRSAELQTSGYCIA